MRNKGFTLFVAIAVTGTILLVALGIVSLATRQIQISSSGRESHEAFYAADAGLECALYWDVQNPADVSAFATTTTSSISCNGQVLPVGGVSTSTFAFDLSPEPFCVTVAVNKKYIDTNGNGRLDRLVTTIESKGYNTCNAADPRRVERAVRATY